MTLTMDQTNPMALFLSLTSLPAAEDGDIKQAAQPETDAFAGLFQTVLAMDVEPAARPFLGAAPKMPGDGADIAASDAAPDEAEQTVIAQPLWLGDLPILPMVTVGAAPAPLEPMVYSARHQAGSPVQHETAPLAKAMTPASLPAAGLLSATATHPPEIALPVAAQESQPSLVAAKEASGQKAMPNDNAEGQVEVQSASSTLVRPEPRVADVPIDPAAQRPTPPQATAPLPAAAAASLTRAGTERATSAVQASSSLPGAEPRAKPLTTARDLPLSFKMAPGAQTAPLRVAEFTSPTTIAVEMREGGATIPTATAPLTFDAAPIRDATGEVLPAALPPASPDRLETENPEWIADLAERISAKLTEDGATIDLALAPDHLGPLDVRLDLRDGRAEVSFRTETAEAARLLNDAQPRLADLLAQQGFNLAGQDAAPRGPWRAQPETAARPDTPEGMATDSAPTPATGHAGQLNLIA